MESSVRSRISNRAPANKSKDGALRGAQDAALAKLLGPAESTLAVAGSASGKVRSARVPVDADLTQVVKLLQRDINCTADPSQSVRKQALQRLLDEIFPEDSFEGAADTSAARDPELLGELLDEHLLRPLLKRLADPVDVSAHDLYSHQPPSTGL